MMRRVAVLSGATSGMGRWIGLGLGHAGYHLVIICRDAGHGENYVRWLQTQLPEVSTELRLLDLASLTATKRVGAEIALAHPRIALLVNNAGMFAAHREVTEEGREKVLTVNHLAPYLLCDMLEQSLLAGAPSRIVNVGSSTADRGSIDPSRMERGRHWGMVRAYRESKIAMLLTTFVRADRLRHSGVVANVVHPGMVASGLIRERGMIGLAWRIMAPFCLSEEAGASTPLHAALDPGWAGRTGEYLKNCRPARANVLTADKALSVKVDEATRQLIADTLGTDAFSTYQVSG